MPRGGHARSGRHVDPTSARSDRRGVTMAVLQPAGYQGRLPGLNAHLPCPSARHRELWTQLWRTPQACVWIHQPWRYPVVAELVRLMEIVEGDGGKIGHWSAIRQRRDDLGLSTAGARTEGWEIPTAVWTLAAPRAVVDAQRAAVDEVGERRKRRSETLHEEA